MLPRESGLAICRELRQTSDVPIIMLTALDDITEGRPGVPLRLTLNIVNVNNQGPARSCRRTSF